MDIIDKHIRFLKRLRRRIYYDEELSQILEPILYAFFEKEKIVIRGVIEELKMKSK